MSKAAAIIFLLH